MAWRRFGSLGLIRQMDGSRYAGQNCNLCSSSMAGVADRQGRRPSRGTPWFPTGASLRVETGDTSGGTTLMQTDSALSREYGINLDVRITSMATFTAKVRAGYPAVMLISYGPIARAGRSGSPGFYDNHSVFIGGADPDDFLDLDPLYDGRRAGIPRGPQWVKQELLREAAGALVLDVRSGRTIRSAYGPGSVFAAFGTRPYVPGIIVPDPVAPVGVTYRWGGQPRNRGLYRVDVNYGRIRTSPRIRPGLDNILRSIAKGATFRCRQTTKTGSAVGFRENGTGAYVLSRKWYGDATGTMWVHESVVDFIR